MADTSATVSSSDKQHTHIAYKDAGVSPGRFNIVNEDRSDWFCGNAFIIDQDDIAGLHPLGVDYTPCTTRAQEVAYTNDCKRNALLALDHGVRTSESSAVTITCHSSLTATA